MTEGGSRRKKRTLGRVWRRWRLIKRSRRPKVRNKTQTKYAVDPKLILYPPKMIDEFTDPMPLQNYTVYNRRKPKKYRLINNAGRIVISVQNRGNYQISMRFGP